MHQPAHPLRFALSAGCAAAIGLIPAIFVATPALAAAGDVTMAITEVAGTEGDILTFELRRENDNVTGLSALTLSVNVGGGSATSGSDYTPPAATVVFNATAPGAGDQLRYISVRTIDDAVDEADTEDFFLTVQDPSLVHPPLSGHGIIDDNDDPPTFALSTDTSVGEAGPTATITATLSTRSSFAIAIPVATTAGTAGAPDDYTALGPNATIPVAAGDLTGTITVPIVDDVLDEADETFAVEVDDGRTAIPDGSVGVPTVATATVTIVDNDATPTVSLTGGGTALEGSPVQFAATLSSLSSYSVTVQVTTSDGTATVGDVPATAGADYTALAGETVTIAPGLISAPIDVATLTDQRNELTPETFALTATNPMYATLGDVTRLAGAITDVDLPPTVELTPVTVEETDADFQQTFNVHLSDPSNRTIVVSYATGVDGDGVGHATAGDDFVTAADSVTFQPGDQDETFTVGIEGDPIDEGDGETFQITLSNADSTVSTGASLTANQITIGDDDVAPTFSVADVSQEEGNPALGRNGNHATFTVTLDHASDQPIDFAVATQDGTAIEADDQYVGDDDYDAPSLTVQVPALATTATITIPIDADTIFEADETAGVDVSLATGETDATGATDSSTLTLENDDDRPTIALAPSSGSEGGDLDVSAAVTGVAQDDIDFDLVLTGDSTAGNNAAEPTDYRVAAVPVRRVPTPFTPVVPGGTPSGTTIIFGSFAALNDAIDEPVETVRVTATDTVSDAAVYAFYRIFDGVEDLPPSVAIGDQTVAENAGSVTVTANLTFSGGASSTEQTMSIPWYTLDGTAHAPGDYTERDDTLTIAPGLVSGRIMVPIEDDAVDEPTQSFAVKLGAVTPEGGGVTDGTAAVDILDDDATVDPTIVVIPPNRTGAGLVKITGTTTEGASVHLWTAPGVSGGTFTDVGTLLADNDGGDYSFSRSLPIGTRVYTTVAGLTSPVRTVRITQYPALTGGSTAKGVVALVVTSNPRTAGMSVLIQQAGPGNTWRTVAAGRANGAGQFSGQWTKLKSGTYINYRSWVSGNLAAGVLPGYGPLKRVGVR